MNDGGGLEKVNYGLESKLKGNSEQIPCDAIINRQLSIINSIHFL